MLKFKNEDARLKHEYNDLDASNKFLKSLIEDLVKFVAKEFKDKDGKDKDVTITMIGRTQAEQAEIYKDDPKFQKKPFKSPHQLMHAVDIRSHTFTPEEIKKIEDYLNEKYNSNNVYAWTAKCHEVANHGEHFHIQYYPKT